MLAKYRCVFLPGCRRRFIERAAHRKEQLRWFANNLVSPVQRKREQADNGEADDELHESRRALKRLEQASSPTRAWPKPWQVEASLASLVGFASDGSSRRTAGHREDTLFSGTKISVGRVSTRRLMNCRN